MSGRWTCPEGCGLSQGDADPSVDLNLTDTTCGYRVDSRGPRCGRPVEIAVTLSYCDEHESCLHDPRCAECIRSHSDAGVCEAHAIRMRTSHAWGNVVRLRTHPQVVAARSEVEL